MNNKLSVLSLALKKIASFDEELISMEELDGEKNPYSREVDREEWEKTLSLLGDKIILVPFDLDKASINTIKNLFRLFSERIPDNIDKSDYSVLVNKWGIISAKDYYPEIDKVEEIFPNLYAKIKNIMQEKNLAKEDVIVAIYNSRSDFRSTKDPFYFAHDLYHHLEVRGDEAIKYRIESFVDEVSESYIEKIEDEDGEDTEGQSLSEVLEEKRDSDYEFWEKIFSQFLYNHRSGLGDIVGDVIPLFSSNNNYELDVPDQIYDYDSGKQFDLVDMDRVANLCDEFKRKMSSAIKKGFLDQERGYVILMDL